jgi:hypothetical protein
VCFRHWCAPSRRFTNWWLPPAQKDSLGAAEVGREYFDYINVDPASRRAYLSHGAEFLVVNADTGAITGMKRNHGVALVPELGRGFISDGDAAQIVVFDLKTFRKIGEVKGEPMRIP